MRQDLATVLLEALLPGPHDEADTARTFRELRFMADYKFNKYEMYQPGRLFLESLCMWLQGFDPSERRDALKFVLKDLIFVSRQEFRQLAGVVMREEIRLVQRAAASRLSGIPIHRVARIRKSSSSTFVSRASLFVGLSDGARIDMLRRHNLAIGNEQVLPYYDVSSKKAGDVLGDMQRQVGSVAEKFHCLFLIDDFCGSGHTLLREVVRAPIATWAGPYAVPNSFLGRLRFKVGAEGGGESELLYGERLEPREREALVAVGRNLGLTGTIEELLRKYEAQETELKGSIMKIAQGPLATVLAPAAVVCFVPLLTTAFAIGRLRPLLDRLPGPFGGARILTGAVLEDGICIRDADSPIGRICEKYYEESLGDEHTGSVKFGFAKCGLPLVLHHNTPNNSLYPLWSQPMSEPRVPLFVRYPRHGRESG